MKHFLVFVALAQTCLAVPSVPVELHVVVSPHQDEAAFAATSDTIKTLAEAAPAGVRLVMWDGAKARPISAAVVPSVAPDLLPFQIDELRQPVTDALRQVDAWYRLAGPKPAERLEPLQAYTVDVPRTFAALALQKSSGTASVVLLNCSPLNLSPAEPDFAIAPPYYCNDATLNQKWPACPYGTVGREAALKDVTVSWCLPREFRLELASYEVALTRFWFLYLSRQGAVLHQFEPAMPEFVERFWSTGDGSGPLRLGVSAELDLSDPIPARLVAGPARIPSRPVPPSPPVAHVPASPPRKSAVARLATPAARAEAPSPRAAPLEKTPMAPDDASRSVPLARPVTPPLPSLQPPAPPPQVAPAIQALHRPGRVGVGIAWDADADVDLWIRPSAKSDEIYFKNPKTTEGRLISGDIRHANYNQVFEYVELAQDHVSAASDLRSISIWVDYYTGTAKAIAGQVVLFIGDAIMVGEFNIAAAGGDRSADRTSRATSKYWTKLSLDRLRPLATGDTLRASLPGR